MPAWDAEGLCPFCKRKLRVAWDANIIEHELPWCETFEKRSGDEFVQAVLDGLHKQ